MKKIKQRKISKKRKITLVIFLSILVLFLVRVFLSNHNIYIPRNDDYVIKWKDKDLEKMIRVGLNKPEEDITQGDVNQIESLVIWGDSFVAVNDENFEGKIHNVAYSSVNTIKPEIDSSSLIEGIHSLDDLIHFRNLETLWIVKNPLRDIGVLSELPKLVELHLPYTRFRENGIMTQISKWTNLDIGGIGVYHTKELSELHNLKVLDLLCASGIDFETLSGLTQLETLSLAHTSLRNTDFLSNLTNLRTLILQFNLIESIDAIINLKELTYLDLQSCLIRVHEDYGPNTIDNLDDLSQLTKLQYLYLYGNVISDFSWISELKQLQDSDWEKMLNYE